MGGSVGQGDPQAGHRVAPERAFGQGVTATGLHRTDVLPWHPAADDGRAEHRAVGGVLGDLAARRGRVSGSTVRAGTVVITATVPLAELFGYATRLRSRTQGRGTFATRATGYAPVPGAVSNGTPSR